MKPFCHNTPDKPADWRPLVYICSPFSGDVEANTDKARRYSRFAVDSGAIPLAPHLLLPQYMKDETERDLAMFMDKVLLGKCEQLWVFGSKNSAGMEAEIRSAAKRDIPIRHFTEDCKEVKGVYEPTAIQTSYKGYLFRSRLEARWAVFFDACGVDWEYEPEGYDLGDGIRYLPDFLLHGVEGRAKGDLYVEVKGKMTPEDATKIYRFSGLSGENYRTVKNPILVVGGIPDGDFIREIQEYCQKYGYDGFRGMSGGPYPFNFETIDGDYFVAHPGINKNGHFELFGDEGAYVSHRDNQATERAFRKARCARFEYGEMG